MKTRNITIGNEEKSAFRQLFEIDIDARLMVDAKNGNIIDANQAAISLYGYSRDELLSMRHVDLSVEPQQTWDSTATTIVNGEIRIPLRYHRKKDGSTFPVEINVILVMWHERPIMIATIRDITVRKQMEDALRESEEEKHTILQSTSDGFWVVNHCGKMVEVNEAYCKMTGYSREEFLSLSIGDIDAEENHEQTMARIARIRQNGHEFFETSHRRKDGSVFYVEISVTLLPNNSGRMVCFCRDITERRRVEAALLESEEKFRSYFWKNKAVMLLIDRDSSLIVDANPAAAAYYGYSLDQLRQMKISNINIMNPEEIKKKMNNAILQNENSFFFTHRLSNGELRQVEVFATPIQIGPYNRILSIIHDITDRKTIEESLRASEARFRHLLRSLPLPIAVINSAGIHTYINERFELLFGYNHDDLPSRDRWRELAFPDENYRKWLDQTWRNEVERAKVFGHDIGPLECDITCKDGSTRSVILYGIVLGDEVLATFTDISDRLRHEQILKRTYERRRKTDLMNELLRGASHSKQLVFECAHILGEKMMLPYTCFFLLISESQTRVKDYSPDRLNEDQQFRDSLIDNLENETQIAWQSPEGIGVLTFHAIDYEPGKEEQLNIARQLQSTVSATQRSVQLFIGISEFANNLVALGEKFRQASTAAMIGSKVWAQTKIYHYTDLGVFQLLSCFKDEVQVNDYIERTLGKILHHDPQKLTTYLDTLEVILMSDNLKESAGKLFVHYQTLMFRKRRLEKILGVSLEDGATKLALLTALQLMKLKKN